MRLIITNKIGKWAANYVKKVIEDNNKFNSSTVLGLPTGSTPLDMYNSLIDMYKKNILSFKNIITFNMDEYIGLPPEHEQSYHYFMFNNFFNHIDIKKENINIPNGMAADIAKECKEYENKIASVHPIDLFIGGAGEDGHLAFNEPYSSLSSKTRDKDLQISTIEANSRFFNNKEEVPKRAITVGIDTIMSAKQIMILMSGYKKARPLRYLLEEGISSKVPISILQMHHKVLVVADEEACSDIKVKTYNYFKYMQDEYCDIKVD